MDKNTSKLPFDPSRWPFFYGWFILAAGTVGVLFSVPGQTIGVSAFTEPLMDALELERTTLSFAYMVGTGCSALLLTFAGKFYDRFGARVTAICSGLGLGGVLLMLSQIDHISTALAGWAGFAGSSVFIAAVMSVGFLLLRFSGQGVMTMTSSNMVMKWFDRHRGLASGIMNAFIPIGFSMAPPIFHGMIESVGWSRTWLYIGAATGLAFTVFAAVFFRDNPEDCGLYPDGNPDHDPDCPDVGPEKDFTLPQARRTYTFWVFNLAVAMHALFVTATTFHIASIFREAGLPEDKAFTIFLPISIIAVTLGLAGGWVMDHTRLKYLLVVQTGGLVLGAVGVLMLGNGAGFYILVAGVGVSRGLFGLLIAVTWPRLFGRTHLGAITGFQRTWTVAFSAAGPLLFSFSRDWAGSYHAAVAVSLAVVAMLFLGGWAADKPAAPDDA